MKSLKSVLESIKPWGSHLVWNMKGTINDNYGKFREIYNDKVKDKLVEFTPRRGSYIVRIYASISDIV